MDMDTVSGGGQPDSGLDEARFRKMYVFVDRLFQNPSFSNLPLPEVEGVLINFLRQNQQQLASTFAMPEYYPGLEWRDVQILFFSALKRRTLEMMTPQLAALVDTIDPSFISRLGGGRDDDFPHHLKRYLVEICGNLAVRQVFDVTFKLIQHGYIDKYVEKIFERREYIYNMVSRKDGLQQMTPAEVASFYKTALLLRNVVYIKLPVSQGNGQVVRFNFPEVQEKPKLQKAFLTTLESHLVREFPDLPELVIKVAIDSNRDCHEEIDILSPSALFLAIIAKRGKDYTPWIKVDKAAEQPDKSWFRVAGRNYLFHGLDKTMIEECYKIAADENW